MKTILTLLFCVLLYDGCSHEPYNHIQYNTEGLVVEAKYPNEADDLRSGNWKYIVKDNTGLLLIRSSENWNVGDTLRLAVAKK